MKPTLTGRDMRYWRLQPDARLRPWVHCYFLVQPEPDTRPEIAHEERELIIPDGYSEIIFNLGGAGFERCAVGRVERPEVMRSSYVIGGRSHSVVTRNLGRIRLAGVKLDPRGLVAVIGTTLAEFSDATLTLSDLNSRALLQLEDALAGAGENVSQIQTLFDQFFLQALRLAQRSPSTDALLHAIVAQRGQLAIMDWIRQNGCDSRSVERRFCAATGMTPKRYARVIRFKHSYHQLISGAARGANSPYLDGFYDQSHFNREFKFFTGSSPSAKVLGRMPNGTAISDHLLQGEFLDRR